MIQMVIVNELMGIAPVLIATGGQIPTDHPKAAQLLATLNFLEQRLGQDSYFGGDRISLADCVAGATVPLLRRIGVEMEAYPGLQGWMERLYSRSSWQTTEPTEEGFGHWQRYVQLMMQRAGRS